MKAPRVIRSISLAVLLLAPAVAFAQSSSTSTKPTTSASAAATADTSGSPTRYASQSDAASKCTGDTVVWANPNSKVLHTSGDRYFGKSKRGFYACEKDAMTAGYHMSGHGHRKHAKSA